MSKVFDRYAEKYDNWYENNKYAYLSELEAVKKLIPAQGYGIEIGVGTGRFAAPLGIDIGIDTSQKMIELARKRGVDALLVSGQAIPFGDNTFDYAAIIVTICFADDPQLMINETFRILKPGGKIIIGIIDKESSLGKQYSTKDSVFYEYARLFSVDELINMLHVSGFKKQEIFQTLFNDPVGLTDIELPQKGYGKGAFAAIGAIKK